jgi:DNA helicase HerA-like ATPase
VKPAETRIQEHLGMITGETSTLNFSFLVVPLRNRKAIAKEDYILVDHPEFGVNYPLIAKVDEVKSYEEVVGSNFTDKKIGKMIGEAEVLGYVNLEDEKRPVRKLLTPPNPGARIYLAYAEFLEDTFTRDANGKRFNTPITIGTLETEAPSIKGGMRPVNFYLDAKELTATHTLISAMGGAGKTSTAKLIIAEIANKTTHATVIIDPYGEYKSIEKLTEKTNEEITLKPDGKIERITETVRRNQTTTLNTEYLTPDERLKTLTQGLADLWKGRLKAITPPFLLVVEEAETLSHTTLEMMIAEGAKHGIALILIAKHPSELGGNILSRTQTQIIGRTTDKDDIDYLRNMTLDKTPYLPKLQQGEWIVNDINKREPTEIVTNKLRPSLS